MTQWHDDDDDDDLKGDEPDDEADDDLDECPRCGRLIYADSERCPRCGQYITREELPEATSQPWWVKVGALVCLVIVVYWILHFSLNP